MIYSRMSNIPPFYKHTLRRNDCQLTGLFEVFRNACPEHGSTSNLGMIVVLQTSGSRKAGQVLQKPQEG